MILLLGSDVAPKKKATSWDPGLARCLTMERPPITYSWTLCLTFVSFQLLLAMDAISALCSLQPSDNAGSLSSISWFRSSCVSHTTITGRRVKFSIPAFVLWLHVSSSWRIDMFVSIEHMRYGFIRLSVFQAYLRFDIEGPPGKPKFHSEIIVVYSTYY